MDLSNPHHTQGRSALNLVRLLVGCYLGVSLLTLVAIILMREEAHRVNDAVWIRGTIVVVSALVLRAFAARAARGSGRAFRRLRIAAAAMVVAIAAIVALPDPFPLWMKIEQGVCGVFLLGVVILANGRKARSSFATSQRPHDRIVHVDAAQEIPRTRTSGAC
jgi:hypothetical protein